MLFLLAAFLPDKTWLRGVENASGETNEVLSALAAERRRAANLPRRQEQQVTPMLELFLHSVQLDTLGSGEKSLGCVWLLPLPPPSHMPEKANGSSGIH